MKYIFLLIVSIVLFSCSNQNKADYEVKAELIMIDTLNSRLNEIKSWLDEISLEEINERKEIINHNYNFFTLL